MFWQKSFVEKEEEEFKQSKLKNKKVYYDISVRSKDPEDVRSTIMKLLETKDYKTILNKLTKFEDLSELDEVFIGNRIKPVKGVIKAKKYYKNGLKFKFITIISFVISILTFIYWFFIGKYTLTSDISNLVFHFSGVLLIISFILMLIKNKVKLSTWIKILGVYDPSEDEADIKIILTGDISKENENALSLLEDDLSSIYGAITSKYVKRKIRSIVARNINIPSVKEKIISLKNQLTELNNKFISGTIDSDIYKKIRNDIENQISQLETIEEVI